MASQKTARILTATFTGATVAIAVTVNNIILAAAAIAIGILFQVAVRRRSNEITVDERILAVGGKAARFTVSIVITALALASLTLIFAGKRTGADDIQTLGVVLSYIACFGLAVYSISYKYFEKKHGA